MKLVSQRAGSKDSVCGAAVEVSAWMRCHFDFGTDSRGRRLPGGFETGETFALDMHFSAC